MTTVLENFGLRTVRPYVDNQLTEKAKELYPIASTELVGIEVEIENVSQARDTNPCWQVTDDGSLRNRGREFITQPIPANVAGAALHNLLTEGLNKTCSFSPRTSVHVHLNVQDLQLEQIGDFVLLYTLFENQLFRFVGRNRIRNPYCVPITQTALLREFAGKGWKARWEKYAGFNLLPLGDKGTIEFRHMHGTFDVNKLSIWIDLITRMKEYIKTHKTAEIRKTISALKLRDVPEFMRTVFGPAAEYLKFESAEDFRFTLLMTKYTMAGVKAMNALRSSASSKSSFFEIKGN